MKKTGCLLLFVALAVGTYSQIISDSLHKIYIYKDSVNRVIKKIDKEAEKFAGGGYTSIRSEHATPLSKDSLVEYSETNFSYSGGARIFQVTDYYDKYYIVTEYYYKKKQLLYVRWTKWYPPKKKKVLARWESITLKMANSSQWKICGRMRLTHQSVYLLNLNRSKKYILRNKHVAL